MNYEEHIRISTDWSDYVVCGCGSQSKPSLELRAMISSCWFFSIKSLIVESSEQPPAEPG